MYLFTRNVLCECNSTSSPQEQKTKYNLETYTSGLCVGQCCQLKVALHFKRTVELPNNLRPLGVRDSVQCLLAEG